MKSKKRLREKAEEYFELYLSENEPSYDKYENIKDEQKIKRA